MFNFFKPKDNLTPFRRTQLKYLNIYLGQVAKEQPKFAIGLFSSIIKLL